jgi:iron complex outermembrane receptor protein
MRQLLIIVFFFGCFVENLSAQKTMMDSVHQINPFEVSDNRLFSSNPGLHKTSFSNESVSKSAQSLADVLSRNTSVFVRKYSPGMLASPSIRGTGAAHTALVWNGLNLQSCMNGQLDLSLVPASLFDNFTLQTGAGSASWGTGAIGGIVFLQTANQTDNHIRFSQHSGSWGFRQSSLDIAFRKKRFASSTKVFNTQVENNFKFMNTAVYGNPEQRQINASQQMQGLLQDLYFKTSKTSQLHLAFWGQKTQRKIPPIALSPISVAKQMDESLRTMASWEKTMHNWSALIRGGFITEKIHFVDSLSQINATNNAQTSIAEAEVSRSLFQGKSRVQVGVNSTNARAISPGLGNTWMNQKRTSLFGSLRSHFGKFETLIQLRQEWFQSKNIPLIPSVSGCFTLNKNWKVRGQAAKSYRLPTLNDLYWQPGGNINLQPEFGNTFELGIDFQAKDSQYDLQIHSGLFSNRVKNWIVWIPGSGYWKPENVQQVKSEGIELSVNLSLRETKKWKCRIASSTQFLNALVEKSTSFSNFESGRQLVYVPHFTWNGNVFASLNRSTLELDATYTGIRFVSSDNSSFLPGFFLLNASFSQELNFLKHEASFYIQINNILNANYQVIAWRPMPLRSFMMGLNFTFKNSKS